MAQLVRKTFAGPPNYHDIRKGDEAETYWLLNLDSPICMRTRLNLGLVEQSRTSALEIGTTCETSCRSRTVGPRSPALAGATPRGSLAASLWPTDRLPRRFRGSPARWP